MKKKETKIQLENMIEAEFLGKFFEEKKIPHRIVSHYDSAYDGLFQKQMGWGYCDVAEEYFEQAVSLLTDIRSRK